MIIGYIVGCLMAALCFLINRILIKYIGLVALIGIGPVIEEMLKTMPAYWLGANIIICHLTFGLLEGIYDWQQATKTGIKAAALSLVGHTLFGVITVVGASYAVTIYFGVFLGIVVHAIWNITIINLLSD